LRRNWKSAVMQMRKGGMIGDLVFDAEAAEPAIGEVQLHFPAERAL
jgi:hypothetical protein